LQNHQPQTGGRLSLMTTMEQSMVGPANPARHVQIVRPSWAWFEVADPKRSGQTAPLRVLSLAGYPAPAWGLQVEDWPLDTEPTLQTWWTREDLGRRGILSRTWDLKPGYSLRDVHEVVLEKLSAQDAVVLESIRVEPCKVPLPQSNSEELKPRQIEQCLVIRLRYPPGSGPYFVRPEGLLPTDGQAHRFYQAAGKYTGIFWRPDNPARIADVKTLHVFSIAELKRHDNTRSKSLKLGKPDEVNVRPGRP
jgi:hypothetical protein